MKGQKRLNIYGRSIKILLCIFALTLVSCMSDGGRKGRPLIKDFSIAAGAGVNCTESYRISDATCQTSCPAVITHVASDAQRASTLTDVNNNTDLTADQKKEIIAEFSNAELCLEGSGVVRPDNAIFIKKDFCSCVGGKRDIVNNCDQFCADTADTAATLHGSVTLGPEVALNDQLGTLFNWCTAEINEQTGPFCVLEVFDGTSTEQLTINIPAGSNTFTANISSLAFKKTYVAKIVEVGSGSNVSSNSFQLFRIPQDDGNTAINSPLKILPTSMYTCLFRDGTQGADVVFENAAKVHFFFASNSTPPPMPANNVFDICHDVNTYGKIDTPLIPRLKLIPQHLALWDFSDIRFADAGPNGSPDGEPDINKIIEDRLLNEYGETRKIGLFGLLPWPNYPLAENNPNLGFIMQAFIDPQSGRGFCPGQAEYNGARGDNLFRVLKEIVGVDTEGLFMSEREPIIIPNGDGTFRLAPNDYLLIREGLLKKIWFYFENGLHLVPDEVTSSSKTIHFYWPPDAANPYVKKSFQKTYTVRAPEDLGQSGATSGLNTSIRPPDKRFACIPSID